MAMVDFFNVIEKRRSVRDFVKDEISKSDLKRIVNAGRLAPCGGNKQAWHFIVVVDKEIINKILIYLEVSKIMADLKRTKGSYDAEGPVGFQNTSAVIAVAFDAMWTFYKEDGSAAVENMLLAASALGYGGCWVHGQATPYLKNIEKLLNIPRGFRLFTMIVLGKPKRLPRRLPKKKLEEILHWNKF
jgi:nitroreductase